MQERLKHSTIATTTDLYVHLPPHVDREAVARTADYIFRAARFETGPKT